MKKVILSIEGMSCSACQNSLEKYLKKQPHIIDASVNLILKQALITYEEVLSINDLNQMVHVAGFKSLGIYDAKKENKTKKNPFSLIVFGLLAVLVLYISMGHMVHLQVIPFLNMITHPLNYALCLCILAIIYLFYGFDILKNGFKNIILGHPNMDTLVTIGVLSSFFYSVYSTIMIVNGATEAVESLYYESASLVLYFVKLGRYIDDFSKEKTKDAIKELVKITPEIALVKEGTKEKEVTIDMVHVGDILICKPGMKVAVDGVIVKGTSHINEAFITGESVSEKKGVGASVLAGSLNVDGYIEYKALKIGKDSTVSEIVKLVVESTNSKAPIARLADQVSGIFVPTIIVLAILTFLGYLLLGYPFNLAITHFVTVLVVACPCALGLATPLAIVVSEGICAKNGILVKSSTILENAHKIDTFVFDKTGTLTYGDLKIFKMFNYTKNTNEEILSNIALIEKNSTHPIAASFKEYEPKNSVATTNYVELPGLGVKGLLNDSMYLIGNAKILKEFNVPNHYQEDENILTKEGCSIIYVVKDNKVISLIGVKDIIRSESPYVIDTLKKMGKEVIMLTGDNESTACVIASSLKITKVISNVMPKDKSRVIKKLLNENKKVMMIGDGINDAPSLALASIGVSLKSGTDIASNEASVILMNNNLKSILNLYTISKKTIKNIKQNLFWAFFYNICMLPVAIGLFTKFGLNMNPMLASIAMTLSSLTVILNALRLKKIKLKRDE